MRQSFHTEESSVCVDYILDTEQEITDELEAFKYTIVLSQDE